jgi:hypothetical protein
LTGVEQAARQTRAELSQAAEARKVEANAALSKASEDVKAADQQVRNAVVKGKIQARAEAESALRAAKEVEVKAKDAAAAATREARDAYAAARATATEAGAKTRAEVRATKAETGERARAAEVRTEAAFSRKIEPVMRGRNFFSEDEIDFANAVGRWTPSQQNNAKVGVRQALRDALKTPETSARLLKNLATNIKAQANLRALFGPAEADELVGAARAASDLREFESQITGAPGDTAETAYKRLMRTLGRRADDVRNTALLDELNTASGGELKPMLYGMEAQPWVNPNRLVTGAALPASAAAAVFGQNPLALAGLASLSPRLVGETARAVGSAFRPVVKGAEMFQASPLAGPVGELNRIPFKANVASQIGTLALPPEEKERLLKRYREPVYQPPVPSPEDVGKLHPDLQAIFDAPASEQPDVGGQAAENLSGASLGERNLNPGNIRDGKFAQAQPGYVGPGESGFAKFDTMESGMMAQQVLLEKNYAGMTVDQIVDRYAPPNENSPESRANYKSYVAQRLGIGVNDAPTDMAALAAAMRAFETGNT